jgi:hemoglobin/transferrin/lactoferrin receptor protein
MRPSLTLACALAIHALGAHAQDERRPAPPTDTGTRDLETVVVSATRTRRDPFTTPAAISLIDQEAIRQVQPYGYQDIFETLPAVNIQGGPRRIAEEPAIRGFSDEQVALRVDGTRLNYNKAHGGRFLLDPALIQSVEVLRGAGASIYGSGALGGVFLIETASGRDLMRGRDGAGLSLSGGYQSNGGEWRGTATGYGSYGELDVLAHVTRRDVGEDLEDGRGDPILATQDETLGSLLKLGLGQGEQRLELALEGFDNEGRNPVNANEVATPTNLVDRSTERRNARLRYQWNDPDRDWLDLSLVAYRNEVQADEFRLDDGRVDRSDFETVGFEALNSAEFALPGNSALRLTAGLEVYEDSQSGLRNGRARPQFPDAEVHYRAGFIQGEIELPLGLYLIPGLRYDRFEYRAQGSFDDRQDSELTPRLALGWQAADDLYLWAEYAEAFRAPSLGELFSDGVHFVVPLGPGQVVINEFAPTPDLRPEHSEQWQAGARWRREGLFSGHGSLSIEGSLWRSDVTDYVDQVVVFISGAPAFDRATGSLVFPGITTNRNVDARLQGAEVSASLRFPNAYLNASLTLIDGERRTGEDLAGVQPQRAALGGGMHFMDQALTLGAELLLSADRRDVPEGALQTPGYGKLDMFLRYRAERGPLAGWEFHAVLDNALDQAYRVHPNAINQPGRSLRVAATRQFDWIP